MKIIRDLLGDKSKNIETKEPVRTALSSLFEIKLGKNQCSVQYS